MHGLEDLKDRLDLTVLIVVLAFIHISFTFSQVGCREEHVIEGPGQYLRWRNVEWVVKGSWLVEK